VGVPFDENMLGVTLTEVMESVYHVHEGVASFHYGTLWTATELWNNIEHGCMKSCVMKPMGLMD